MMQGHTEIDHDPRGPDALQEKLLHVGLKYVAQLTTVEIRFGLPSSLLRCARREERFVRLIPRSVSQCADHPKHLRRKIFGGDFSRRRPLRTRGTRPPAASIPLGLRSHAAGQYWRNQDWLSADVLYIHI